MLFIGRHMYYEFSLDDTCIMSFHWTTHVLRVFIGRHMYYEFSLDSTCITSFHWTAHVLRVFIGRHMYYEFSLDDTCIKSFHWTTHVLRVFIGQHMYYEFSLDDTCITSFHWTTHVLRANQSLVLFINAVCLAEVILIWLDWSLILQSTTLEASTLLHITWLMRLSNPRRFLQCYKTKKQFAT
jgi:hypothetical protein